MASVKKNYWEDRNQQLWDQLEKDENKLIDKLVNNYAKQSIELEKEIAAYYLKYGESNVIKYNKLMEQLGYEDKRLLIEKMDAFGQKYPQYKDLLPVRESIYKLNRLEGLQRSIYMSQLEMGVIEESKIKSHLAKQYERGAETIAQQLGFGENFYVVNKDILSKTINAKWCQGKNFSDRIWENKARLTDYLNNDFAQAIARGDNYAKCAKLLKNRFDKVSSRSIKNLVYTEGTYILNEATITPFEEDFEEYSYSAVGDGKTCELCNGLNEQTFKIKDRMPGVNFPPLHTCCRCSFTIVVGDDFIDDYVAKHGGDNVRFKPLTNEEIELLQSSSDLCYNKFNKAQREALEEYTLDAYEEINGYLRGEKTNIDNIEASIANIDEAISKYKLSDNLITYRGDDRSYYAGYNVGSEIVEKAYYSTSLNKDITSAFSKENFVLEIRVPKGSKCLYVGGNTAYDFEAELLIGRNTKYKIIDKTKTKLILEVIT